MRKGYLGKKIISMSLAGMMMLSLCACGSDKSDTTSVSEWISTENIKNTKNDTTLDYTVQDYPEAEDDFIMYDMAEESGATYDMAINGVAADVYYEDDDYYFGDEEFNTNEYNDLEENPWLSVKLSPLSTFAADVDTASYSQIRTNITNGYDIDPGMVRIEEMINYFHYDYETPTGNDKFAVHMEYADCPWNEDTQLALVSLNTEKIDFSEAPESNIVFLIDTSGSMFDDNKLPLVQQSMCMLAENLTAKDRVSIVTYAGGDEVVLEGAKGSDYYGISSAIEGLEAWGSTNGAAGIETAYQIAEKYFIKGGNNRVILATDGDLNVGVTSESALEQLITEKKESGVFLSVIGVGYGNYKDNKLETLADKGNGNYAYIDSIYEAKKALVDDLGANMVTVAKDVKLQVEFNPALVKGYRLIGYENRTMAAEDFNDDTKDGGEMGAGHSVTAIYEIIPVDSKMEVSSTDLKYSDGADNEIYKEGAYNDELFTLRVRYKEPDEDDSKLMDFVCKTDSYSEDGSDNLRWAASVAAFGMYLKDSEYMGDTNKKLILTLAESVKDSKKDEYKQEYIDLVNEYFEELD
ncbi:MAG: VWA domain-containing protein [Lachnospiraceae bacterium]|nr:VWA domain-containing protein [Lachnospiraceae bacterium]